tara:strand:+ start:419 stop:652 length:234 start_codon:yes stop_codon:yes gene_type:complete
MSSSILEILNEVELKKRKKDLQIQIKKINNELEKYKNISNKNISTDIEPEKYKNISTDIEPKNKISIKKLNIKIIDK